MAIVKIQAFVGMRVKATGIQQVPHGPALDKDTLTTTGLDQVFTVPPNATLVRIHVKEAPVLMEINGSTNAHSEEYPATAETPWIEFRGVNPGDVLNFKNA